MIDLPSLRGFRTLVTGHTGFKGSWLCSWLKQDGAEVAGLALAPEPNGQPNLFEAANVGKGMRSSLGDIRAFELVEREFQEFQPEVVFHLAAQPLVRRSYRDPLTTFSTNVMGTAHVLEAARRCGSVRAIVCVTTDKVYDDKEWVWGYREDDPLGGADPYSASKAAAEIVAGSYRRALLPLDDHRIALATARGGNVVGGGDWSEDRLVPDIVRFINAGEPIVLRNPRAIRPWQHVLELLAGYLTLAHRLLNDPAQASDAWNFGPGPDNEVDVEHLARSFAQAYGDSRARIEVVPSPLKESHSLKLDIAKSKMLLGWRPRLDFARTIGLTAEWYRGFHREGLPASDLLSQQIEVFREYAG
ncbi:MAG: CDP-glucose 4,6-dehydratase [Hyphomicrobiales bacterium]|nr:CDP-glucose 4,6-dehydratase [Hyphomicrobiales bacterium]